MAGVSHGKSSANQPVVLNTHCRTCGQGFRDQHHMSIGDVPWSGPIARTRNSLRRLARGWRRHKNHGWADSSVRTGGTAFQREVWGALREIACGTTVSYAKLAERIGRPNAVRAVGLANGSNPVGVVVPCHRVIGSDGSLTGYGGGIERKRWLLEHEGKHAAFRLHA